MYGVPDSEGYEAWVPYHAIYSKCAVVLYVTSVVLNVYFIWRLWKASMMSFSFRMVLCTAALSFSVHGGSRLAVHLWLDYNRDVADRYLTNCVCKVLGMVNSFSGMASVSCMNLVAVEQHLATIWVRTYEKKSFKVGVVLMIVLFFQCVPSVYIDWDSTRDFDIYKEDKTCIVTELHWYTSVIGFSMSVITCTLAAVWIELLKRKNRKRAQTRHDLQCLSAKYQQMNNARCNEAIAPSLVGYMIVNIFGCISSMIRKHYAIKYGENFVFARMAVDFNYSLFDYYSIFHMACFLSYNSYLKKQVMNDIDTLRCRKKIEVQPEIVRDKEDPENVTKSYFDQFGKAWQ